MATDPRRILGRLWQGLSGHAPPARPFRFPAPEAPDRERFAAEMAGPAAGTGYAIHFTPRSGSSWLTDIAARTGRLGIPGEYFNPNFMPRIAQSLNARDMDEYVSMLARRRARGGVWGFEVTHHQIRAVFGSDAAFLDRFGELSAIWLVRRDIVAQGVSLAKMAAVGISHAPSIGARDVARAERGFAYDAAAIRHWIAHIRAAETGSEALFAAAGIAPLRLAYEDNTGVPPHRVVKRIARHVGLGRIRVPGEALKASPHNRVGTGQNRDFAKRFRDEEAGWLAAIEAARAPMLARIETYPPGGEPDGGAEDPPAPPSG
ncbi:Stf0 family sulfotransferase [Wenxinia marina]|uniref:Sulphotransferase Stf0 domain-containing protein n=1 Tax=Wenxinia marina DSM 24838 TaxID=1123501 RepID=A0A0D0PJ31_9RHOB|nr:Stf0 family sulfotransferase [Wenxinia marina]KIQ71421.1 hypothetical protein Wenmar_04067 [Wenxinia marina DSM 24838]GGL78865.1 hypothetical protein GCM10011392_36680 [Wenxinia marina]